MSSDESIWMASKICTFLGVFLFTLFYNVSLSALNITVCIPDSGQYWFLPVHMWILFCSSSFFICFHSVLSPTLGGVHPAEKTMSLSNLWTCFTTSLASGYSLICAYIQPHNSYSHLPCAVHSLMLQLLTGHSHHCPHPPTPQSVLQKVTINISILIAPAEKSVFTHSWTEVEIEVQATNSVSEVTFVECDYSKIHVI